jgi:hypothetical protein
VTGVPRSCPLCGNPTASAALLEAHVGPPRGHPRADVVVWLCPACALQITVPSHQPTMRGWRR